MQSTCNGYLSTEKVHSNRNMGNPYGPSLDRFQDISANSNPQNFGTMKILMISISTSFLTKGQFLLGSDSKKSYVLKTPFSDPRNSTLDNSIELKILVKIKPKKKILFQKIGDLFFEISYYAWIQKISSKSMTFRRPGHFCLDWTLTLLWNHWVQFLALHQYDCLFSQFSWTRTLM